MFEQVKTILIQKYKAELEHFDELKVKVEEMEEEMKDDTSEQEYQNSLKELNKKYGLFKRGKQYKKELLELQLSYQEKLNQFKTNYENYLEIKREASLINIYGIQKKLDQLNVANSLKDLKMTEEEATKIIQEQVM